ncbi:MAG: DNA-directed RNA polymerase subunit alpha C-terminal domain-containing protein, partial [bacterium]|nr:DNA-directed RNA polymerase subunit alpha C-terminal domain-containing protein [bacterium]
AWNLLGIEDNKNRLRAGVITMAKTNNPIFIALRQQAAEIHRPITNNSPLKHLPISKKVYNTLAQRGCGRVGDIVSFLEKHDEKGMLELHNFGKKGLKEVLDALAWADIKFSVKAIGTESTKDEEEEERKAREEEEFSGTGVEILSAETAPLRRIIRLEQGEIFTTEIVSEIPTYVRVVSAEKSFIINGRRITIKVEG